jgi:hypothetical protein
MPMATAADLAVVPEPAQERSDFVRLLARNR